MLGKKTTKFIKKDNTSKQGSNIQTSQIKKQFLTTILLGAIAIAFFSFSLYLSREIAIRNTQLSSLSRENKATNNTYKETLSSLEIARNELTSLKEDDQIKRNEDLENEIDDINDTYTFAVSVYEDLIKFKETGEKTDSLDDLFTESVLHLSNREYTTASAKLKKLSLEIDENERKLAAAVAKVPANIPVNNTPPGAGYRRQTVQTDVGSFLISMVAADIGSTRVIVDTASDGDCGNECPVLSLGDYISRNGAFAGINGTYFCPASYPSCSGKTNSFDLLVMNKNKHYFNSGNNVYSNNPAAIFGGGYVRFVSSASQWGRDTGVDGVISNFPLLVFNNNITFGGDDDPKKGSRAGRSFVANKGNTVYIGVVHSSTVVEAAHALKTLGMDNAMNLDSGGSTAFWSGGYKSGPGRNIPNAILFVKR